MAIAGAGVVARVGVGVGSACAVMTTCGVMMGRGVTARVGTGVGVGAHATRMSSASAMHATRLDWSTRIGEDIGAHCSIARGATQAAGAPCRAAQNRV